METKLVRAGTLPTLDGTNYLDWAKVIRGLLKSEGLWGYVDGSNPKPAAEEDKEEVRKWEMEKCKAWLVIMTNCSLTQQEFVVEEADPSLLWEKLEKMNMPKGKHRLKVLSNLSNLIITYKQSPNESVVQVYTTLRRYQTEIASLDPLAKLADVHLFTCLLNALDSEVYDRAVFQLRYNFTDVSIEEKLGILKEVEMEERIRNSPKSAFARQARGGARGGR